MAGTHDKYLVTLSIAVAMFASFTALSLASRIRASRGRARHVWLWAAALALGGGIWSMHFVAMLAFSMPGMGMSYDLPPTLLSLCLAVGFTGAGLAMRDSGGVAHDFNNLLTPILGVLDRLHQKGVGDERDGRLIAGALQSAERARTLVQRLLSFARRQTLQPVPVDVSQLIRGMSELITSTIGPQVKLNIEAPTGLPAALADANQLEMALLNLSVDARDAMPQGGKLEIAVSDAQVGPDERGLLPGHYVRLCIADSGLGMDADTLKRAVEPFFSTKGIGRGTGLGLSMAHGLAAQLGGALTIDSTPGQGTRICVFLPQTDAQVANTPSPVALIGPRAAGEIVLLVDDEELVRTSTAQMLADLGYDVTVAASGKEALAIIERGLKPDLLITDHLMPEMTGIQLTQRARSLLPSACMLIISGYADLSGIDAELPRLTKPFRQADLSAMIATLN